MKQKNAFSYGHKKTPMMEHLRGDRIFKGVKVKSNIFLILHCMLVNVGLVQTKRQYFTDHINF